MARIQKSIMPAHFGTQADPLEAALEAGETVRVNFGLQHENVAGSIDSVRVCTQPLELLWQRAVYLLFAISSDFINLLRCCVHTCATHCMCHTIGKISPLAFSFDLIDLAVMDASSINSSLIKPKSFCGPAAERATGAQSSPCFKFVPLDSETCQMPLSIFLVKLRHQ